MLASLTFDQLNADIFTLFSGSNRHLYEAVPVKIYEDFYRSDLRFPSQAEIVGLVYETLASNADLWREDEAPVVLDQVVTRKGRRIRRARMKGDFCRRDPNVETPLCWRWLTCQNGEGTTAIAGYLAATCQSEIGQW
ncbi:hypothetical protein ATE71_07565 [Sphingopyxis sp. H115]|nr:hypothetical protein ATE71_07565 [Sphingopyxis sp. H115]